MKTSQALILFALLLAIMLIYTSLPLSTFNVGPEGISVDVYKIVYSGEEAILGNPSTYVHDTWVLKVVGTKNIVLEFPRAEHVEQTCFHGGDYCTEKRVVKDPTDVEVRVSASPISFPTRSYSVESFPFEREGTVEWETKVGGKIVKRKAVIVTADTWVEIRTIPNTGFDSVEGVYIWFIMKGVSWQPLVEEPEAPEGYKLAEKKGAFIPVLAYIKEAYEWAWVDSKDKSIKSYPPDPEAIDKVSVHPAYAGDVLTLYHEPSEEFVWPWEIDPNSYPEQLKSWLSRWSPEWSLRERVYFKLYIRRLQPHVVYVWGIPGWIDRAYYPSTVIKVRTVALAVGEFTYVLTEEEAEKMGYEWEGKGSKKQEFHDLSDWLDAAWQWLNSPQGMFTMFLLLVGLLIFALVYTGTLPVILHIIASRR